MTLTTKKQKQKQTGMSGFSLESVYDFSLGLEAWTDRDQLPAWASFEVDTVDA